MAIARLSVKVGKKGKGALHASYIAREGKYEHRLERGERLEAKAFGNMPAWAHEDPQQFWLAADAYERKNGNVYREMEIALPRELTATERTRLVEAWVQQEMGDTHAYQWAIHVPAAADGGEQPHCHLMYSDRQNDDVSRDPAQYFRRYNAAHPERGGSQKANSGLTMEERKSKLLALRERWQHVCNQHLENARSPERIDMRSYAAQRVNLIPEPKMLPSEWRKPAQRQKITEYRHLRCEQVIQSRFAQTVLKVDIAATTGNSVRRESETFRAQYEHDRAMDAFYRGYQGNRQEKDAREAERLRQEERRLREAAQRQAYLDNMRAVQYQNDIRDREQQREQAEKQKISNRPALPGPGR